MNFLGPLLKLASVRNRLKCAVKPGPTPTNAPGPLRTYGARWRTTRDGERYPGWHGPEAGVIWTARAALAVVRNPGGQRITRINACRATFHGADFVLECEGVTREDLN